MIDERRMGRRKRIGHVPIQRVRKDFQLYLDRRGLDEPVVDLCQRYGLVDEQTGFPRRAEAVRLLLYVAFMRQYPNRIAATADAAVRANKPMMLGGMFARLQKMLSTVEIDERTPVNPGKSHVHLRVDPWLYQAMQSIERNYRAGDGVVDDIRMACDAIRSSLADPDLPRIAQLYATRVANLRQILRDLEEHNRKVITHGLGYERPIGELLRRVG